MSPAAKPIPPHGERPRYMRGCRCLPCRDANRRYCKQYRVKTVRKPIRVDATPVRRRLQEWADRGYSQTQIGDAVGKKSGDISKILAGQPTIAPSVAARILCSPGPTGIPTCARIDSTGTIRRGQALHAIGYPLYVIAEGIPMATNHLARMLAHQPATVSAAVAQGMTALYEKLRWRPGTSHFAIHNARRHGWHGPLAWDDIDNPNEQPDTEPADDTELNRDDLAALRRSEVEHLSRFNLSSHEIAQRLNIAESTVNGILRELRAGQRRQRTTQQAA
ncbi:hypothetical protein [Streptomyces canus]|uniref:hypothetical protein n=1 Tax=Streptomyces canus TaxID=58343 RepID=UPI00380A36BA